LPVHRIIFEGRNFIGFKKFKGKILNKEFFCKLDQKTKNAIAKSLGEFLSALHGFNFKTSLKRNEFSSNYCLKSFKEGNEEIFRDSLLKLPVDIQEKAKKYLSDFIQNKENLAFKPCIVHGDFSSDHIIFDEKNNKIIGIIDFGDLCLSDPAYDFYALDFEPDFSLKILKHYKGKKDNSFVKRMEFYRIRGLFFGLNSADSRERIKAFYEIEKIFTFL